MQVLFQLGSYLDDSFCPHDPMLHGATLAFGAIVLLLRIYYRLTR